MRDLWAAFWRAWAAVFFGRCPRLRRFCWPRRLRSLARRAARPSARPWASFSSDRAPFNPAAGVAACGPLREWLLGSAARSPLWFLMRGSKNWIDFARRFQSAGAETRIPCVLMRLWRSWRALRAICWRRSGRLGRRFFCFGVGVLGTGRGTPFVGQGFAAPFLRGARCADPFRPCGSAADNVASWRRGSNQTPAKRSRAALPLADAGGGERSEGPHYGRAD